MANRNNKNNNKNKKIIIFLMMTLIVSSSLLLVYGLFGNDIINSLTVNSEFTEEDDLLTEPTTEPTIEPSSEPTDELTDEPTPEPTEEASSVVTLDEDEQWKLVLVNDTNSLGEDFEPYETSSVDGYTVDSRIVDELEQMIDDAAADGVTIILTSAYRSYTKQNYLFTNRIERMMDAGMTYSEALEDTMLVIQEPGCSEHQTGLAIDLYTTDSTAILNNAFADTEAYEWLIENSYKYGFVERYAEDKEDITIISWESWHYRYVGVEVATYLVENDLCLEEYIELIS